MARPRISGWWKPAAFLALLLVIYAAITPGAVPTVGPLASERETIEARFTRCGRGGARTCVHDGDSLRIGPRKIRILGIDAPEISNPGCASERQLAEQARARLIALLNEGPFELVKDRREDRDRYGRELRSIERGGQSIGQQLIDEGLAAPYLGRKASWC